MDKETQDMGMFNFALFSSYSWADE